MSFGSFLFTVGLIGKNCAVSIKQFTRQQVIVSASCMQGVKVFNPAFDVTDHELIAGIVTEFGIARPPYTDSFKEIFAKKEAAQKNK